MNYTDSDNVYATCTAAADLIERHGLFRGSFWGRYGMAAGDYERGMPMCTLGAIRVATGHYNDRKYTGTPWESCAASQAVRHEVAARLDLDLNLCSVAAWNDDAKRTSTADVVSLLRDVAAKHQPDEYRSGALS